MQTNNKTSKVPKDGICHKHLIKGCSMCGNQPLPERIGLILEDIFRQVGINSDDERLKQEAADQINALLTAVCEEVIGETEVAWKKPRATTRNKLRLEQRAKLKQLNKEK